MNEDVESLRRDVTKLTEEVHDLKEAVRFLLVVLKQDMPKDHDVAYYLKVLA
jgi:hypothetical protein